MHIKLMIFKLKNKTVVRTHFHMKYGFTQIHFDIEAKGISEIGYWIVFRSTRISARNKGSKWPFCRHASSSKASPPECRC